MGVTLSAGKREWRIGFEGFVLLRDAIALAIGVEDRKAHYHDQRTNTALMGYWIDPEFEDFNKDPNIETVNDPIEYLLLHMDYTGILPAWAAGKCGERLREITDDLPAGSLYWDFGKTTRSYAADLADLLTYAGEDGYIVHFA
ncbi:hypothetical protein SEA_BIG4_279 [Microbacterium phage Big4]|nr:hypothetical protein SEA_BIG4_279 [Microbacterium phage Big4]